MYDERQGATARLDEVDALAAELVRHAVDLAKIAREDAELAIGVLNELSALLAERARGVAPTPDAEEAAAGGTVPPDVLDVAVLDAQLDGMSVEDYLRDAVLAYSASRSATAGRGDLDTRLRRARREAARLLAEGRALQAQTAQVGKRAGRAGSAGDGGPPSGSARVR